MLLAEITALKESRTEADSALSRAYSIGEDSESQKITPQTPTSPAIEIRQNGPIVTNKSTSKAIVGSLEVIAEQDE